MLMRTHLRLFFGLIALVIATTFAKAQWSEIPELPVALSWPMTAEHAGKIYVFGGLTTTASKSIYVYTPGDAAWQKLPVSMPKAKYGGFAATINGKIYIVGGMMLSGSSSVADTTATLEFDPVSNTFTRKAYMPTKLGWFAGAQLDGKIYVIGGYTTADKNNIQIYDPATDTWTASATKAPYLGHWGASAVANGAIYVMGGQNSASYLDEMWKGTPSGTTIAWEQVASIPEFLSRICAGTSNGKIVLTGGVGPTAPADYANTWIYDPATDSWKQSYGLPVPAYNGGALVGPNQDVYFIGGYANTRAFEFNTNDPDNPVAIMAPEPIFINLPQNQVHIAYFSAKNLGTAPLSIQVSIPEAAKNWLTVGTSTSTVEPLTNQEIGINLLSGTMESGMYKADVTVTTNDPVHASYTVPVMLYVVPNTVQPQKTKVVIEEGTGDWCGYCPQGHEVIESLVDEHGDAIIPLSYHGGGTDVQFMIPEGTAVLGKLKIQGYPNAAIQRWVFPGETIQMTNRGDWARYVQMVLDKEPYAPAAIRVISYKYDNSSKKVTAKLEIERATAHSWDPSSEVHLNAIVVENGVIGWQNDYRLPPPYTIEDYEHNRIVRQVYPDEMGQDLAFGAGTIIEGDIIAPGDKVTVNLEFDVTSDLIDPSSSRMVFMVHSVKGSNLERVLQGYEMELTGSVGAVKTSDAASNVAVSNFPNPVVASTTFTYSVSEPSIVNLAVYDVMGREVARIISNETHSTGTYEAGLNASQLSNGTYTYVLTAGMQKVTGTMIVQK
jgi:hypothetical protein